MNPFLEAADRIGARLCRDAIWSDGRCTWLGGDLREDETVVNRPLGADLYAGTSGVALFLHVLAEATGESIFKRTAEGGLRQALTAAERIQPAGRPGFYMGWGGIAHALLRAGRVDEALKITARIPIEIEGHELDMISGSAGAIAALLNLAACTGETELVEAARRHGDLLIAEAQETECGLSWRTLRDSGAQARPNLTGFSHGAAGIAWSLLELWVATGEDRYRWAAEEGFRYECSCYSAERENWPDFRYDPVEYAVTWCHGAPGIAFSRLRAWQILGSPIYREQADAALRCTAHELANSAPVNFSLCHGLAGNADLLLYSRHVFGGTSNGLPEEIAMEGIERYQTKRSPWPCGLPGVGETPGLMLGLAGIGYFFLRLVDSERYSSVLMPSADLRLSALIGSQ
jgi:lantibiotic modifying enzyme